MSIIGAVLPLIIRLIGMWLDSRDADLDTKKAWLNFVNMLGAKGMISKSLNDSYEQQGKDLDEEIARMEKEKNGPPS